MLRVSRFISSASHCFFFTNSSRGFAARAVILSAAATPAPALSMPAATMMMVMMPQQRVARRHQVWCSEPPGLTWMCPAPACHSTGNVSNARACLKCGTPKPVATLHPGWICQQCSTGNPGNVKFCRDCAAPFRWPATWQCPSCLKANPVHARGRVTPPECCYCPYTLRPKSANLQLNPAPSSGDAAAGVGGGSGGGDGFESQQQQQQQQQNQQQQISTEESQKEQFETQQRQRQQELEAEAAMLESLGPPGFPWMCRVPTCGAENNGAAASCAKCAARIVPADWMCGACGVSNYKLRSACFNCTAPIQPYWFCTGCSTTTSSYEWSCRQCGLARPEPAAKTASSRGGGGGGGGGTHRPGDWVCNVCHKFNYSRRTQCMGCETPRGGSSDDENIFSLLSLT